MEKKIEHKIKRLENVDSLQKSSLIVALDKIRADLEINELHLQPLRKGNKVVWHSNFAAEGTWLEISKEIFRPTGKNYME